MDGFIEFAVFAGAIIASIGLALGLEWLSISGFFRLMPKAKTVSHGDLPAAGTEVRSTGSE
jgi:hypothetical protein